MTGFIHLRYRIVYDLLYFGVVLYLLSFKQKNVKMKILHYIPSIDQTSGGVGSYLKLLASSLGKHVELHVVSHHSPNELTINNCIIHYIDNGIVNILKSKRQFLNLLNAIQPDVVHVNACWEPLCSYTIFGQRVWDFLLFCHRMVCWNHGY